MVLNLTNANSHPSGVWIYGSTAWVADGTDDRVYVYNLLTGAREMTKEISELHSSNGNARGIWGDGITLYVADSLAMKESLLII